MNIPAETIFAGINLYKAMIGAMIGAGLSVASSLIGGAASRRQAKKAENILAMQKQQNEDWYSRRYNEDYTQTAEAQRALTMAREEAMRQIQAARGAQAVMGGTEESVAQTQDKAGEMISNTLGGIAAQGTARKDAVESDYLGRKDSIAQQYYNLYNQRASNVAQMAGAASQSFANLAMSDLSSHLMTGKGLFEGSFRNGGTGGAYSGSFDSPRAKVNREMDYASGLIGKRLFGK